MAIAVCSFLHGNIMYAEELTLDFVSKNTGYGQCGCWYYFPESDGVNGRVIAQGEAAEDGIYIHLNGKTQFIGNWKASYSASRHFIDYSSETSSLTIDSKVLRESRYSGDYSSILTLQHNGLVKEIKAFGSCGC